jgi:tRNA pseudouridine55 synthase
MVVNEELCGVILVNKPKGWSSFDVVRFAKKKLNFKKIGHAGTLDPMAEGLLILLVGAATKKFDELLGHNKEYWAKITLGQETDTYDSEGDIVKKHIGKIFLDKEDLEKVLSTFLGEQIQTPPKFSALKINGQPAYRRARRGEDIQMSKRKVFIEKIELIRFSLPDIYLRIVCSSGTYIRTIAFDIGRKLKYGAYLSGLKRVKIGDFNIENAIKTSDISPKSIKII